MLSRRAMLGLGAGGLACAWMPPVYANNESGEAASSAGRKPNDFGVRLLSELARDARDQNVILSPLSISVALDMLTLASEGETYRMLVRQRKLPPDYFERRKDELAQPADPTGASLLLANSVWLSNRLRPKPTYSLALAGTYGAAVRSVDFARPQTTGAINAWVKSATRDRIPSIVESLNAETMFAIVNAAYFKSRWLNRFDSSATLEAPFVMASGQSITIPMMSASLRTDYRTDGIWHAISLPYEGDRFDMVLVTAKQKRDVKQFLDSIKRPARLQQMAGRALSDSGPSDVSQSIAVSLPRFNGRFGRDLVPFMVRLGLGDAFGRKANLGQLGVTRVERSALIHRAFVEVNEEGTEAAAATAIVGSRSVSAESRSFVADRPFVFFIRDRKTQLIAFSGLIQDPR